MRPTITPTTSTPSTVPTQPTSMTKPANKPVGLKLTHDTPKNDIFADMIVKQGFAPAANDDPFANDMSFSNTGSDAATKKGKPAVASPSGRSQQSSVTSNNISNGTITVV